MGKLRVGAVVLASVVATAGLVGGSAGAQAPESRLAEGEVEVFILDALVPVKKFPNPDGCYELPVGTHVVINDTDSDIHLHATPNCEESPVTPSVELASGYGAHELPVFGSFSA